MVEICEIAVAAFVTNPGYLLICLCQHFCRESDADILDIVHECLIGLLLEVPAE